jgi:hypothetical protein
MLSPVGKVSFSSLAEPDTRFFQDGVYSITLEIPPEDSKDFLLEDQSLKLRFKMKAGGVGLSGERWSKKPEVFDADLNPIEPFVPSGSTARVSFIPANYYTSLMGAGISLRLTAVQVKDLINIHPVTYRHGFTPL